MTNQKKLLLIDGSSVAFRAFFALYNQIDRFRNNNGLHTNAIYGFHLMLDNLLERIQPTHVLVAFDAGKTTFRTAACSASLPCVTGPDSSTPAAPPLTATASWDLMTI